MKTKTSFYTKSSKIVCCATLMVMMCIIMTACTGYTLSYTDVDGFDICHVRHYNEQTEVFTLVGISKLGKHQEELVIPKYINEVEITHIGSDLTPCIRSNTLKKLFWNGKQHLNNDRIVGDCAELSTVVLTSYNVDDYKQFFTPDYAYAFYPTSTKRNTKLILIDCMKHKLLQSPNKYYVADYAINSPTANVLYYYNYPNTDVAEHHYYHLVYVVLEKLANDEELWEKAQMLFDEGGYDNFNENDIFDFVQLFFTEYNYDEEILNIVNTIRLGGYAWIDYLEPGDKINTLPPTPQREGYEFAGWYIDEQCTTKINFKNIVKEDADIKLYAGWR